MKMSEKDEERMELIFNNVYSKYLNNRDYVDKFVTIYMNDNSIDIDDILTDYTIYLHKYKLEDNDKTITEFLKVYARNTVKYKSYKIFYEDNNSAFEDKSHIQVEEKLLDSENYKKYSEIGFSDIEIKCLLYIQDKSNFKLYDYYFIERADGKGVDKRKLQRYSDRIIKQLLKYITKGE